MLLRATKDSTYLHAALSIGVGRVSRAWRDRRHGGCLDMYTKPSAIAHAAHLRRIGSLVLVGP